MKLTDKASTILQLATLGKTDKEIAHDLGLQPSAIDWHWRRIRRTLHAANRTEAVAKGLRIIFERERHPLETEIKRLAAELDAAREETKDLQCNVVQLRTELTEAKRMTTVEMRKAYAAVDKLRQNGLDADILLPALERAGYIIYRYDMRPPFRCSQVSASISALGYDQSEFTEGNRGIFDIIYPDDLVALGPDWEKALETPCRAIRLHHRYIAKDGRVVWALSTAVRLGADSTEIVKIVCLLDGQDVQLPALGKPFIATVS